MRTVVFDIETSNWMGDGVTTVTDLEIAVVGVYDSETDSYRCYMAQELPELWPVLERTDVLVGYNSDYFDIPLLNKYYPGDLTKIKSIDLMKEVYHALNRRLRLDAIADGTLGVKKIGDGAQSLRWWRAGEIDKVRNYCLKDVEITKRIYDHALEHGAVKFKELGRSQEIKLDTSKWLVPESSAMTFSLGI